MGIWIRNGETKRGTGTWNDFHGIFTDLSMSLGAPMDPWQQHMKSPFRFLPLMETLKWRGILPGDGFNHVFFFSLLPGGRFPF